MSTPEHTVPPIRPLAGLAALVLPGLGHLVLGETKRGVLIAIGVLGLFFGGLFIGGIDSVDSKEDKVWFIGQALVGPLAFGVDYIHQNQFKVKDTDFSGNIVARSARPNEGRDPKTGAPVPGGTPPNIKSLAKVNEIGTLFSTIAGMLNLIVIMDALLPIRRPRHVGLQTTLADAAAPLNAPAAVQDPHRGEMPKA